MRRNSLKIYFNAPITLTFVAICVGALILNILTRGYTNDLIFSTYDAPLTDPLTFVRLICHVFGHADIDHLIGNMLYILLLGPILEDKYGTNLIFVILITALVTGIIHNIIAPYSALLGASGVVFAFILLASFTGNSDGIPITAILVAVLWLGGEVIDIFTVDSVSQMAHIIGGIVGAIMGFVLRR